MGTVFFFVLKSASCSFSVCRTYLEFTWHYELWSVYTNKGIDATEEEDGQDDGKVAD